MTLRISKVGKSNTKNRINSAKEKLISRQTALDTFNSFRNSTSHVKELFKDYLIKIENVIEYNMDEIEIKIESVKIQLDQTCEDMKNKCDIYAENLKRVNRKLTENSKEPTLFDIVTMNAIENKTNGLKKLKNSFASRLNNFVVVSTACLSETNVGEFKYMTLVNIIEPVKVAIVEAIKGIPINSIFELKCFVNPPHVVSKVATAVCIILGLNPPSWQTFKKQELTNAKLLLNKLSNYDLENSNIPMQQIAQYVNDPDLRLDVVRCVSKACSDLMSWIVHVYKYNQIKQNFEQLML